MQNDPTWPNQTWVVPVQELRLERENDKWYLTSTQTGRIAEVEADMGLRLVDWIIEVHRAQWEYLKSKAKGLKQTLEIMSGRIPDNHEDIPDSPGQS